MTLEPQQPLMALQQPPSFEEALLEGLLVGGGAAVVVGFQMIKLEVQKIIFRHQQKRAVSDQASSGSTPPEPVRRPPSQLFSLN